MRTRDIRDLAEAAPDPLALLNVALPTGVAVEAYEIFSRDAGMSWRVLACAEHENAVGFVPACDVDYVNLYLVEQATATEPSSVRRYLVAELWRYRPAAGVKICHQWVIWQDEPALAPSRADYAVLIEDLQNVVLDRRAVRIGDAVLERLARFSADAFAFFEANPPGDSGAGTITSLHGETERLGGNRLPRALY